MNLEEVKRVLKQHKNSLFPRYAILNLAIFGSVSRGEETLDSDLDILVEFKKPIGIRFIDLADELEEILKIKVDLVSKDGVKPKYLKYIEQDLTYV
ncbi:MAG: nucleotidyltransferase family protein [Phaeodactylibacter sp.]|nr:nucleotidyltransferase family protein [Phaeodactylibacter sp.]MCB9049717.1 nucleotidyltransferase family protein [Lewinellaceae bacterium]